MFEDSLLESGGRLKKRNPWATAMSFALEGLAIGLLVLVPMIYTEALPIHVLDTYVVLPDPPRAHAPTPPVDRTMDHRPASSNFQEGVLVVPQSFPDHAKVIRDRMNGGGGGGQDNGTDVIGAIPGGSGNDKLIARVLEGMPHAVPRPALPTRPVTVSRGVSEGLLLRRVTPEYPVLAKQSRTQGTVVLAAMIGRDGTIQNLQVLSGHPFLTKAAMEAVRQWRYRPYLLNGEPVEVETTITVNFNLN
jgi:protein TonB